MWYFSATDYKQINEIYMIWSTFFVVILTDSKISDCSLHFQVHLVELEEYCTTTNPWITLLSRYTICFWPAANHCQQLKVCLFVSFIYSKNTRYADYCFSKSQMSHYMDLYFPCYFGATVSLNSHICHQWQKIHHWNLSHFNVKR